MGERKGWEDEGRERKKGRKGGRRQGWKRARNGRERREREGDKDDRTGRGPPQKKMKIGKKERYEKI